MKLVQWTDDDNFTRQSWLRDTDSDKMAKQGVPHDPPDLSTLDWIGIQRDIHNDLVALGIIDWNDFLKAQGSIPGIILHAISPRLVELYKLDGQRRAAAQKKSSKAK